MGEMGEREETKAHDDSEPGDQRGHQPAAAVGWRGGGSRPRGWGLLPREPSALFDAQPAVREDRQDVADQTDARRALGGVGCAVGVGGVWARRRGDLESVKGGVAFESVTF